jgi:hypothetical protein
MTGQTGDLNSQPYILLKSRNAKRLVVLIILVSVGLVAVFPAAAQSFTPPIIRNEAVIDFPSDITFHLELAEGTAVTNATLIYDVSQTSCLEADAQVPVEVEGNRLEWTWVMSRSGNPPPGAEVWWEWTLTDDAGNTFTTPRQTVTLTDDRFDWQSVTAENIRLNWYQGDDVGPLLLDAAVAGLHQLQDEMGIQLQTEAQFYIYGSSQDMRDAVLYIQDWAGGVAFSEYNTILMGVPPSIAADWGCTTVRHELAHLVIGQFGASCVGGHRPTWLNEGLAVYAEGEPDSDTLADIENGIRNNQFEPLRSLNGAFPAHDAAANMAYSQSYSVVDFMLTAYGQEKMQDLILTLAEGEGYDDALLQVYEVNVDGIETAWRAAIGAPVRQIPPTPTPLTAASVPTAVPISAPVSVPTPPAAAALPPETKPTSTGVCGLGLIPLLLVTAITKRRRFSAYD